MSLGATQRGKKNGAYVRIRGDEVDEIDGIMLYFGYIRIVI